MNNFEDNLKIAKFDGFQIETREFGEVTAFRVVDSLGHTQVGFGGKFGEGWHENVTQHLIPNYFEDLAAIRRVELKLNEEQHRFFRKLLFANAYNFLGVKNNDEAERLAVSASAEQRAKALIQVVFTPPAHQSN